jgi:hypothetical protein
MSVQILNIIQILKILIIHLILNKIIQILLVEVNLIQLQQKK